MAKENLKKIKSKLIEYSQRAYDITAARICGDSTPNDWSNEIDYLTKNYNAARRIGIALGLNKLRIPKYLPYERKEIKNLCNLIIN